MWAGELGARTSTVVFSLFHSFVGIKTTLAHSLVLGGKPPLVLGTRLGARLARAQLSSATISKGRKSAQTSKFDIEMQCAKDEYASRLMYKPYMTASARKSDKAMRSIANFYHLL